jgi:hypothetical protein
VGFFVEIKECCVMLFKPGQPNSVIDAAGLSIFTCADLAQG